MIKVSTVSACLMSNNTTFPSAAYVMRQMLWPIAMALTAFIAFGSLMLSSAEGRPGEPGLLIFPPIWDQYAVLDATWSLNAPLINIGPAHFVVSIFLEDNETISRAYEAGALFVLNAKIASICGSINASRKQ